MVRKNSKREIKKMLSEIEKERKTFPKFEYHTKDKRSFKYLWKVWGERWIQHQYSIEIYRKTRTFVKENSIYIRAKLLNLETMKHILIDFDTEISKCKFRSEMCDDLIKKHLDWILSYCKEEIKGDYENKNK